MEAYQGYNFTALQSISLNVFFDLAQEFPTLETPVYAICLLIPGSFSAPSVPSTSLYSKTAPSAAATYRLPPDRAGELADLPFPQKDHRAR